MKKGLTIILAAFFLVVMVGGSSHASSISGTVWYNVIGYSQSDHDLLYQYGAAPATGILGGSFTVDALNFDSQALSGSYGGPVTYTQFLSNSLAGAPGPNNLQWAGSGSIFGATTLITSPTYMSFFQFVGVGYFSENFSIRHDDGFVLFIDDYSHVYDYSYPTAPEVADMTLVSKGLSPGYHSFLINYAAWNSFPEVLQITSGIQVPEPTTMLLLGLGVLGLAGLRRRD